MSKISIVIPVYYNSDTLRDLYDDLKAKVLGTVGEYEIVFVDDGSGDDSWKIMNEIRLEDRNTRQSSQVFQSAPVIVRLRSRRICRRIPP